MLASGLVLGIAAGLATGGRLRQLSHLIIRWWPLLVVAVFVRAAAPLAGAASFLLVTVSLTTIVIVAAANWRLPGIALAAIGAGANLAVVLANGGMPVDPSATRLGLAGIPADGVHVVLGSTSTLSFLGDVFAVPPLGTFSIGDVLIAAGTFWTIFAAMRQR
jgi:hypothetical protein